jgi:hypothetical protein
MADLTLPQKLLVAAKQCPPEFGYADLTAKAFELFPEAFAMTGHPKLPDSHKVLAIMSGARGMTRFYRWLERVRPGRYRVTEAGRCVMTTQRVQHRVPHRKTPQTFETIAKLERGERISTDELSTLAAVHRFLGDRFVNKLAEVAPC